MFLRAGSVLLLIAVVIECTTVDRHGATGDRADDIKVRWCKEPPKEALHFPELTCDVVENNLVHGHFFTAFANKAGFGLVKAWAWNLRRALGVDPKNGKGPVVAAMEEETQKAAKDLLRDEQIELPNFVLSNTIGGKVVGWGGSAFRDLGREKARLVHQLTNMGNFTTVITDADVMWVTDPIPYFKRFPDVELLGSTDNLATPFLAETEPQKFVTNPDRIGEDPTGLIGNGHGVINIGIMAIKGGSDGIKRFSKLWLDIVESSDIWDQSALNNVLKLRMHPTTYDEGRKVIISTKKAEGSDPTWTVKWGMLNPVQFASGQTFWVSELHKRLNVPLYCAHADYTNAGIPGKMSKFRMAGLWDDPAEYYKGQFLTFDLQVPDELLVPYENINIHHEAPDRHMQLVNHQLKQVAHAAAIAHGLGRTLVIPPIKCICENAYAPFQNTKCRWGNAPTAMPYNCPPDQIFKPGKMNFAHRFAPGFFESKDYTYTDADTATLVLDGALKSNLLRVKEHNTAQVDIEIGSSMEQIRHAAQKYGDKAVMKLVGNVNDMFGGFDRVDEAASFEGNVKYQTTNWCCTDANMAIPSIGFLGLDEARDSWLANFNAKAKPQPKCVADRKMQKVTNAKGASRPATMPEPGSWWGASYPDTAEQMCQRRAVPNRCRSTSDGLCKAADGREFTQTDKDNWEKVVEAQRAQKEAKKLKDAEDKKVKMAAKKKEKGDKQKAKTTA